MTQSEANYCSRRRAREMHLFLIGWQSGGNLENATNRKRPSNNNFVPDILAFSTHRKEPVLIHTTVHINNITYFELQFHLKQNKKNYHIFKRL